MKSVAALEVIGNVEMSRGQRRINTRQIFKNRYAVVEASVAVPYQGIQSSRPAATLPLNF